jgi:hypothetical protein
MDNLENEFKLSCYVDPEGREFYYIHVDRGNSQLGVHYSAFFGDWGDAPKYRQTFGGYFHRLKILGSDVSIDWLFLCDAYGADENGTYYIGTKSDPFVENAILEILRIIGYGTRYPAKETVMIGSSMGATAALKFGLLLDAEGVIAISPHIDLDICARLQGRERHVAWVLNSGNTQDPEHYAVTRQIQNILTNKSEAAAILPQLFVQSCRDDDGVHFEQVIPLLARWSGLGGQVWFDDRRSGGHTSEFATRSLLLDVVHKILKNESIPISSYKWKRKYRPYGYRKGSYLRSRRLLGKVKRLITSNEGAPS